MPTSTVSLEVTNDHSVPVEPLGGTATVLNASGDTLYYADNPQVSSVNNQGSLTAGQSTSFTSPAWVRSAGLSSVLVAVAATPFSSQLGMFVADPAVPDGKTDNTSYLAFLLTLATAAGQALRITGGKWCIKNLTLPSGATVNATGASFTLPAGSASANLLTNVSYTLATPGLVRDSNIKWIGGSFDHALTVNSDTFNDHVFMLAFVDGLEVGNVSVTQGGTGGHNGTGGMYSGYVYNCTSVWLHDITATSSQVNQGTWQFYGATTGVVCERFYGTYGDDVIAFCPRNDPNLELAGLPGVGDIRNITIRDVFASSYRDGVRITTGQNNGGTVFYTVGDMRISNMRGAWGLANSGNAFGVIIGSDSTYVPTSNGNVTDIQVENVTQTKTGVSAVVVGNNGSAGEIHGLILRNIHCLDATSPIVFQGATHMSAKVCDTDWTNTSTSTNFYAVQVLAAMRTLEVENLRVNAQAAGTGSTAIILTNTNGSIGNLVATDCRCTGHSFLLGNFQATVRMYARGLCIEDTNGTGYFGLNAGSSVNVREFSGFSNATADGFIFNAGAISSQSPTFRCDLTNLTRNIGDMAWNTNAGLSCGVGPCVCTTTSAGGWKNLATGATF